MMRRRLLPNSIRRGQHSANPGCMATSRSFKNFLIMVGLAFISILTLIVIRPVPTIPDLPIHQYRQEGKIIDFNSRQDIVCNTTSAMEYPAKSLWDLLCKYSFLYDVDKQLHEDNAEVNVVQIGAHTGFEQNDPFAVGIIRYLNLLPTVDQKSKFIYSFVEPSPPNFKRLQKNVQSHSNLCHMQAINAAIVSDSLPANASSSTMTFYSIRDTIDPDTGYDNITGFQFPKWVSQISSFSRQHIRNHGNFGFPGNFDDYVVETNVTVRTFSDLMSNFNRKPLFVLIDTEGYDCVIVLGISPTSAYLPQYLVFEHRHCKEEDYESAKVHLQTMNYTIHTTGAEDTFAYLPPR